MALRSDVRVVAIIPARMGSSRFPGKPLAPLLGRPMVEHVFSQHGAEGDERLIESRLERWRKEWRGRAAELDAAAGAQRMAEINLVDALLRSKVWKLPEAKAAGISRGCVSEDCRRRYGPR